jgi:hypothetical protein
MGDDGLPAEPVGFSIGADETADVEVHLTARDLNGNLLFEKMGGRSVKKIPQLVPELVARRCAGTNACSVRR